MSRRSTLRFSIATALGATALMNVGLSVFRKRNIDKPRNSWKYVQMIRADAAPRMVQPKPGFSYALLTFEDDLAQSGLSHLEITSDAEYHQTIIECEEAILDAMENDGAVNLEYLTREFALVLEYTSLHHQYREQLYARLRSILKKKMPIAVDTYVKNGRNSTISALQFARTLHYANTTLDDVYQGEFDLRANMREVAAKDLADVTADPKKSYHTVELCTLLDETMGLDMKSTLPAGQWEHLAKIELRQHKQNLSHIFTARSAPAPGSIDEAFLTPNVVAAYAGIDHKDPDYRAAIDMGLIQMDRVETRGTLRRRLLRGESY